MLKIVSNVILDNQEIALELNVYLPIYQILLNQQFLSMRRQ